MYNTAATLILGGETRWRSWFGCVQDAVEWAMDNWEEGEGHTCLEEAEEG